MELALVLRELWSRKRWLAVGIIVSAACATLSIYQIHLSPPGLVKRTLQYSAASVDVYIDTSDSFLGDSSASMVPGADRAPAFANVMASPGAMDLVGRYAGIPGNEIWAAGPIDPAEQRVVVEPTATKRSYQVVGESLPYRIEFLADPNLPTISIFTQAPTTAQALRLANASVTALTTYVRGQETAQIPAADRVVVREAGPASGGIVNGGISKKLAGLVFVAVFLAWCMLVMAFARLAMNWRLAGRVRQPASVDGEGEGERASVVPRRPASASADAREPLPPGGRVPVAVKSAMSANPTAQPK
jgi:hypothetical protein